MTFPTLVGHTETANASTSSITIAEPPGAAVGDYMVMVCSSNSIGQDLLAGWTWIVNNVQTGTLRTQIAYRIKQSGDPTSYTWAKQNTTGNIVISTFAIRGATSIGWGTLGTRQTSTPASGVVTTAPTVTTTAVDSLVVTIGNERTSATETAGPALSQGTEAYWVPHSIAGTSSIETVAVSTLQKSTPGATGDTNLTYQNTQTANAVAIQVAFGGSGATNVAPVSSFTYVATGLSVTATSTSTDSDGTIASYDWDWEDGSAHSTTANPTHAYSTPGSKTITLTVTDNSGDTNASSQSVVVSVVPSYSVQRMILTAGGWQEVVLTKPTVGFTVSQLLATPQFMVAHRGLGGSYNEQSMAGYDAAVGLGFMALEASLQRTSDGVFVLSHDDNPSRVFGQGTATWDTRTWASVQGFTSATGPILRLEQLLDKYGKSHVLFLDDKTNGATVGSYGNATDALRTLVKTHALNTGYTATDHFVWKGFKGWVPAANKWTIDGFQTWGIYYDGEPETVPTYLSSFSILGMQWDASTTSWNTLLATGKKVINHVISTDLQRTTGQGKGASGHMITTVAAMP